LDRLADEADGGSLLDRTEGSAAGPSVTRGGGCAVSSAYEREWLEIPPTIGVQRKEHSLPPSAGSDIGSSAGLEKQGETDRRIFMRMYSQIIKKKKLTG
jgi:hypothetical protein